MFLTGGAAAQTRRPAVAAGRVLLMTGRDSTAVGGAQVVLHHIGRDMKGPIDSMVTGGDGRFLFRFPPDTSAVYLLSVKYRGIQYFSPPVHTNPSRPDTALIIRVADTSTTQSVAIEARHLVISRPGPAGARDVLDVIVLGNRGPDSRVAPDSIQPSWGMPLGAAPESVTIAQSDFSPDAVTIRHDSVLVFAPISPGERQIVLQYLLPAGSRRISIPVHDTIAMANVLLEEMAAGATGGTLAVVDSQTVEGRLFQRISGTVPAGGVIRIRFPGTERTPPWLLALLVGVVGAGLIVGVVLGRRRRVPMAASVAPPDASVARRRPLGRPAPGGGCAARRSGPPGCALQRPGGRGAAR